MLRAEGFWAVPTKISTARVFGRQPDVLRSSNSEHQQSARRVCGRCFASVAGQSFPAEEAEMARTLPPIDTLQAVLFDVDGTLADSDPLHYVVFREMLQKEGYMGGKPITKEFFSEYLSGKHNPATGRFLFPDWEFSRQMQWLDEKEVSFRRLAAEQLASKPGLDKFAEWINKKNLRRAAVTNAARPNAEQIIASVGLKDFFEFLIVGDECKRGKPFPDPYLEGLKALGVPAERAIAFEDSTSGIQAAVAAKLAVVGVVSGNPAPSLLKAGAAFTVEDYADPGLWSALGETVPS